ncbi:hypothetical protein HY251_07570, partial [bacterium]|nr:hypothetical protein [bacterium]
HCELWLTATPGAQPGQEYLGAFRGFFESVDMGGMKATIEFVRGSGAAETYGCRRGDDELVVYLKGGDFSRMLDLKLADGSYDVRVVDPATNATLSTSTISGGDTSVSLSGAWGDGGVHVKKH